MRGKKDVSYIGVTGFMTRNEVEAAFEAVPRSASHHFMVGVLMSSKTLAGFTNDWPGRYPRKERVAEIFNDHPLALNLIHYNTDASERLFVELHQLTELGGLHLDGFQLNIAWPSIAHLEYYRDAFPEAFVVLQVGQRAMAEVDESPEKLADMVGHYVGIIDAILIDPSGGESKLFDHEKATAYLRAIRDRGYFIGLGIAGGLKPETLHLLASLLKEFPELNMDAQQGLRTPKPEDALDIAATKQYLAMSYNLCRLLNP